MEASQFADKNIREVDPFVTRANDAVPKRVIFEGLPADSFRHPLDKAATEALRKTKGFDTISKFFSSAFMERMIRIENVSEYVKVGEAQYPQIYRRYLELASILAVPRLPELFVENSPVVNAFAMGIDQYTIRVTTALLDIMDDNELDAILAHELGHVKCDHVMYRTMAYMLNELGSFAANLIPVPGLGQALLIGVQLALLEWYRKAEFSCDRASLLGVQDVHTVQSALGKLAGFSHEKKLPINVAALVDQAGDYEEIGADSLFEKALKVFVLMDQTHPYPVVRVKEIGQWADSPQYRSILNKDYEPVKEEMWYVAKDGNAIGPMTFEELRFALESGRYRPDSLVFTDGMGDWKCANQVEALKSFCKGNGRSHLPSIPTA